MSRRHRANAAVATPLPPLPTSTPVVGCWVPRDATAASWRDYVNGLVLPLVGSPAPIIGPSAKSRGRTTVKLASAASYVVTGLTNYIAAGARPWMCCVFAQQTPQGAGATRTFFSAEAQIMRQNTPTNWSAAYTGGIGTTASASSPDDTLPHIWQSWADGVNANSLIDAALAVSATAWNVPTATTAVSIGGNTASGSRSGAEFALCLITLSKPTAAEIFALLVWSALVGTAVDPYDYLLGANKKFQWRVPFGIAANPAPQWTDKVAGFNLVSPTAPQNPDYVTDGSFFRGKPVLNPSVSGLKCLLGDFGSSFSSPTQRPCLVMVGRIRNASAAQQDLVHVGSSVNGGLLALRTVSPTVLRCSNGAVLLDTSYDLQPHVYVWGIDGVTNRLRIDGVEVSAGGAGNYSADMQKLAVGSSVALATSADLSIAALFVLPAWPTDATLILIENQLRAEFFIDPPSPLAILGAGGKLKGWYRDTITPGIGSKVAARTDLSPNGNHLAQATATKQPTLTASVLDGRSGITFVNTPWLQCAGLLGFASGSKPRIYEVVRLTNAAASSDCILDLTPALVTNTGLNLYASSASPKNMAARVVSTAGVMTTPTTPLVTGATAPFKLLDVELTAADLRLSVNNVLSTSIATANAGLNVACNYLTEGSFPDASGGYEAEMVSMEMIVCNPAPTPAEHDAIIAYLRWRYPSLGV